MADLRGVRVDVGDVGALVVGGYFKSATGAGRGFLENQRNVVAFEVLLLGAGVLGTFQVAGQVQQVAQLARGVVFQAQQVTVVDVERHDDSPWIR
ncbi:hypothetical protein D3C79_1013200 [compost metagenome]